MSTPRVSVIVPFSKPDRVGAALEKLTRQTYPAERIEILLVGPGSSALAERWPVRAVETQPIYYPGEARNIGARAATSEYFLFLDDDCEPASDWIEQNVRELDRPGVGAVGGRIAGKSKAFFAQCIDFSRFAFSQVNTPGEMAVCSASLGVKRRVFEEAHGFSEELRSEEDMDFCYRLVKMGYKTVYQPAIKVEHDHRRRSLGVLIRYSYFYGRVSGLYVKRLYPEMSRRNKILTGIQNPVLYPLLMIPVSLGATLNILRVNMRQYPRVLLYAPFIFLSKLSSHVGIWLWLLRGHPVQPAEYKQ